MPRETQSRRRNRTLRSQGGNPLLETVLLLQSRVDELNRRLRRAERENRISQEDIQELNTRYLTFFRRFHGGSLLEDNRTLQLQVDNLERHVDLLRQTLRSNGIPVPTPVDRNFSSLNLSSF